MLFYIKYLHQLFGFGEATSLLMSSSKSQLIEAAKCQDLVLEIVDLFSVDVVDLDSGFKYLGFYMKLNNYGVID